MQLGMDVGATTLRKASQSDRSIDVIEGDDSGADRLGERADPNAFGNIGADDDKVGIRQGTPPTPAELVDAVIEVNGSGWEIDGIAVGPVPRRVAFQEQHIVTALRKGPHEAAVGGRVAIAPGRGNRQTENDDAKPSHWRRQCCGTHADPPSNANSSRSTRRP